MSEPIEGFRLSPQQTNQWHLGSAARAAYCDLRIEGKVDAEALRAALLALVTQHDSLRTTYHSLPGLTIPIQVIGGAGTVNWSQVDLAGCSAEERTLRMKALLQADNAPFDLQQGPQLRASLYAFSTEDHLLRLCLPEIACDYETLTNLALSIRDEYRALRGGEPVSQPQTISYIQFSEWQNGLLEEAEAEAGRAHWRQWGDFLSAGWLLPYEREGASSEGEALATLRFPIDSQLTPSLVRIADQVGVSPSSFLLGCWLTLLWRVIGDDEIVAGLVCDGRQHKMLKGMLGLMARAVPVRARPLPDAPFTDLLHAVEGSARDAHEWQCYFTRSGAGSLAHPDHAGQLFSAGFEFQVRPSLGAAGGAVFSLDTALTCRERFQVKLHCVQTDESLALELHYDTRVFDAEAIQGIGEALYSLIESAVQKPGGLVRDLVVVGSAERRRLLECLHDARSVLEPGDCIHTRIEEQARQTPNRPAVRDGEAQLTYRQLDEWANQVARRLRAAGVGPECLVGLCMERSVEAVVGLLGILKAGGAYIPLDPAQPAARIALQIRAAEMRMLVTHGRLAPDYAGTVEQILCLDDQETLSAPAGPLRPAVETQPDHLAYVIFTSGSTGIPKGVAISHRAIANYTRAIAARLNLFGTNEAEGAHVAMVSTLAADLGNTALFPTLASGDCLHILPYDAVVDGSSFARYLADHPVDFLKIVPSHLSALLDAFSDGAPFVRKGLILGGEALPISLVHRIRELAPNCRVWNHYGPTEATVGVLTHECSDTDGPCGRTTVPIGRPLANVEAYILDERFDLVSAGVPGELYLGGASLARGYVRQPRETALRFVPHPFSRREGERLYRTGDRARYLPDGSIEFLGRIDHQVKVRGHRIELGEIESVLALHPAVRQAVVLAEEDSTHDTRLVAYVVPGTDGPPVPEELRRYLKERLPEYMLPASYPVLPKLPLTPNGKLDRSALSAAKRVAEPGLPFTRPRTPTEAILAGIWSELLGVPQVSVADDFFDLGGHSLLAVRLCARIEAATGRKLPLSVLFQAPTVERLAGVLQQQAELSLWTHLVPIRNEGWRPPLYCVHGVLGEVLCFRDLAQHLGPDQPFYGLQAATGGSFAHEPVEALAARYLAEIRMVQPVGPYCLAGYSFGGLIAFQMAQELVASGEKVALLAVLDSWAPGYPLTRRPVSRLRTYLGRLKGAEPSERRRHLVRMARFELHHLLSISAPSRRPGRGFSPTRYAGDLVLFRALEQAEWNSQEFSLGWEGFVTGKLEVEEILGDHRTLLQAPHVDSLAAKLRRRLMECTLPRD